jgi:hypothetical protein
VIGHDCVERARAERRLANARNLGGRVGREAIDGDDHGHAKLVGVANVVAHVGAALGDERHILVQVRKVERRAGRDGRTAAVHFERANSDDEHDAVGHEARLAALDVEEFLHACRSWR